MPKGNPKPQTVANAKYQAKIGMVAKTYKLKQELVDDFKTVCDKAGESQSSVLSRLMREYIESKEEDE